MVKPGREVKQVKISSRVKQVEFLIQKNVNKKNKEGNRKEEKDKTMEGQTIGWSCCISYGGCMFLLNSLNKKS